MTFKQVLFREYRGNRRTPLFIKEDVTADIEMIKDGVEENAYIIPDVVSSTACMITADLIPG